MEWKEQLRTIELNKQWDLAIDFMQKNIKKNSHNTDMYIYINFLLMNLIVEEDYDSSKHDYYVQLLKEYFYESYEKFSHNAEYLFCTGMTIAMAEWYVNSRTENYENMLKRAMELEPENLVYKITYYMHLDQPTSKQKEETYHYARLLLQDDSSLVRSIRSRGAFGEYLLSCMQGWAERTLQN